MSSMGLSATSEMLKVQGDQVFLTNIGSVALFRYGNRLCATSRSQPISTKN
jgi:hypothetical protein